MVANEDPSRAIPEPMKREIRKRCGFGCVICGLPVYHYEHMDGWAKVKVHIANRITLLCPNHHEERTRGILPSAEVEAANANPQNLKTGHTAAHDLRYTPGACETVIGNNQFRSSLIEGTPFVPLSIDGIAIAQFESVDGHLLLSARLYDTTNKLVLLIERNCLIMSVDPWDIAYVGRTLTMRSGSRNILLELLFETDSRRVSITRGRILLNGVEIKVDDSGVLVANNGNGISGMLQDCGSHGLVFGKIPQEFSAIGLHMDGIDRRSPTRLVRHA